MVHTTRCLCPCDSCANATKDALDKAWEESFQEHVRAAKAGKTNLKAAWKYHTLSQLRSAYYLYVDNLEDL